MQRQGGGSYDVRCGCDMQKPLPDWAFSLSAARNAVGGKRKTRKQNQKGGSCASCGPVMPMRGGGCGCNKWTGSGGGCGCNKWPGSGGGYKATKRNRKYLAKYRRGESIGFTMKASLKAKGLLPRTSKKHYGKKVLGPKYK